MYKPAEDSYLFTDVLKREIQKLLGKNPNLKFLEIGAGSGIHLQTAEISGVKKENVFSSDIDEISVAHCKLLGYNCIKSDLFRNINGKYNLIIFNPPYLPEDEYDKNKDTSGGKKGSEVILRFLEQAKDYLEKEGRIFLLTSSLTPEIEFGKFGYKAVEIGCEKLFYERLCVWELVVI